MKGRPGAQQVAGAALCADAGSARGVADRLPQRIVAWISRGAGEPMQIVKFRDRSVARLEHFDEQLGCHDLQVLRPDAICQRIHRLAPGPKTIPRGHSEFGVSGHGALEGMTVRIGHTRHDDAVETLDLLGARSLRLRAAFDRSDHPLRYRDQYIASPSLR